MAVCVDGEIVGREVQEQAAGRRGCKGALKSEVWMDRVLHVGVALDGGRRACGAGGAADATPQNVYAARG